MNMFRSLVISASGLSAERLRMDIISANIANADSTRSPQGGPYRRQVALLAADSGSASFKQILDKSRGKQEMPGGVRVVGIEEDPSPTRKIYDPQHPDAAEDGYVEYPNVEVMKEMVELITASRAYEANVTVINSTKNMALKTLEIGRG